MSGPQLRNRNPERGFETYVHQQIGKYKNDVDCIRSFNDSDPSTFLDSKFDYDINNNKVYFKSRPQNPFSTPDLDNTLASVFGTERNVSKLISIVVDMFEAETEYVGAKFKNKRYEGRSIRSLNFLKEREKFAIGAALSSSISKIFEILFENFVYDYASPILRSRHIVKNDGDNRRVSRLTSRIINSSVLPGGKNQYFTIDELKKIFGEDIEDIITSETRTVDLITRVNNSLKDIQIPYLLRINAVQPSVNGRIVGDTYYVITLGEKDDQTEFSRHDVDFSMVGEGTRSIISLLMQIEIHRAENRRTPCVLTIREFENHLHPSLIGRFFKYLVKRTLETNIDLIVETHSEIILRTLQTIIKNSKDDIDGENLDVKRVAIYYVDKKNSGDSTIEQLNLTSNGYFEKAPPKEFFDINSNLVKEMIDD